MKFWVKLIEVSDTLNNEARKDLQINCMHITGDYWLFEGEDFALDQGISFNIIGEEAIPCYGGLSGSKLKEFVHETYNVDKGF